MFNKIQVALILFIIPFGALYVYMQRENLTLDDLWHRNTPIVHFGDLPVRVEIVQTPKELAQGLSGRDEIGKNLNAMFFVFPTTERHGIWMKDMRFPIDIVWVGEDLEVVGITKNVAPDSYPKVFRPDRPVRYVLETEVGYPDLVGIHVGQKVRIPLE